MKSVFICGTDTGVGKTLVSGLLFKSLLDSGKNAITQKWVQTGSTKFSADIDEHFKIADKDKTEFQSIFKLINPYCFKYPASPHLASKVESIKINKNKIKQAYKKLSKMFDHVIIEGVGGALVPIDENKLIIDVVKELNIPVLIVVGNKLGAINHTLLTIEALRKRKIKIIGIVFNNVQKGGNGNLMIRDNPEIVQKISNIGAGASDRVPLLGVLPHSKNAKYLYKSFKNMANGIVLHTH